MAISMAKTIKEERLRWVKPIAEKRVKLVNVSKVCPHSKRSLERWVAVYKRGGEKALDYTKATIQKERRPTLKLRLVQEEFYTGLIWINPELL